MAKILLSVLLGLTACTTAGVGSAEDSLYKLRVAYVASFLTPATIYNELPRCILTDTTIVSRLCSRQDVVAQLRRLDDAAMATIDGAEDVIRRHPELNVDVALAAASTVLTAGQKLLDLYGIGKP